MYHIIEGRSEADADKEKNEWERARWSAAAIVRAVLAPHSKTAIEIKPQDLAVFPWEQQTEIQEQPKRDPIAIKEIFAKWDAHKKKVNGQPD